MNFHRVIPMLATFAICAAPAFADALSTPVTYNPGARSSRFQQRVQHLKEQIDMAESKGLLSPDQVSKFKADHQRLAAAVEQATAKGMTTTDDLSLEKDVTSVHHYLHQAINTPQPAAK